MSVMLDFSRQAGLLDADMLAMKHVVANGLGRNRATVEMLAATGVARFTLLDPGTYESANVSQCGIRCEEVGKPKVKRVKRAVRAINPSAVVSAFEGKHSDHPNLGRILKSADLIIDGTDSVRDARSISARALKYGKDVLHLKTTGNNEQFLITGTLNDYNGCFRCIHKMACDRIDDGYEPPAFFRSHRAVPETLNVKAVWIALGLLHFRARSELPIAEIGRRFAELPAWIGFNGITDGGEIFPVRAWREPLPTGWVCPDCGAVAS